MPLPAAFWQSSPYDLARRVRQNSLGASIISHLDKKIITNRQIVDRRPAYQRPSGFVSKPMPFCPFLIR